MKDFELYLVSNGSMGLFPHNSLSAFTNHLAEPIHLEGDWRVSLAEITIPSIVKNLVKISFSKETRIVLNANNKSQYKYVKGAKYDLEEGLYHSVDELLQTMMDVSDTDMQWNVNPVTQKLSLTMQAGNGFTFRERHVLDILGFSGRKQWGNDISLGHKIYAHSVPQDEIEWFDPFTIEGDYPVDISGGRHLTFVYLNIIEYQNVGDSKSPLLRFLSTDIKLNKGTIVEKSSQNHYSFRDLQWKPLLSSTIQSIKVELRNESGDLIPYVKLHLP